MNFVVDDIVKGISDNYCITDMDMTRGRILSVHGDEIEVRVMSHKSNPFCLGASYVVEAQYFEKIGHIKPFNREEVLELIAKGNQNKLNEYDFYGADLSGANLINDKEIKCKLTKIEEQVSQEQMVELLMSVLTEKQKEILKKVYWEQKTHKQIASMYGMSRSSVSDAVHKALMKISRSFDENGEPR